MYGIYSASDAVFVTITGCIVSHSFLPYTTSTYRLYIRPTKSHRIVRALCVSWCCVNYFFVCAISCEMLSGRSFLNYLFLFGLGIFHVYVIFLKRSDITAHAFSTSKSYASGCPLRFAKSFLHSAFMAPNSLFLVKSPNANKRSVMRTTMNLVDSRDQGISSYMKTMNGFSRSQLFAAAESMSMSGGGTSTMTPPALKATMSVPLPNVDTVMESSLSDKKVKKRSPTEALEVVVLGLSHHNAKVEVREKLAIPEDRWNEAAAALCEYDSITEACVLSTCNRFELYLSGKNQYECMRDAMDYLHKRAEGNLDMTTLRRSLFLLSGEDAIWHLMRVSAGLDSLIVGEGQILAQVKRAHERSSEASGHGGRVIARMLNSAVTAGKRVRSETGISKGAVSVSSAAAEFTVARLTEDIGVPSIKAARIMIVGAGKMARLLLVHLQILGVEAVTVVNRDLESITVLQSEFPDVRITPRVMSQLYDSIAESDVVYPCTASTVTIIDPQPLEEALQRRREQQNSSGGVMFVDISVPRNVHPDCSGVNRAVCYNVDDLKAVVQRNTSKRKREMLDAEVILREEQNKFRLWQHSLGAIPTITRLQEKAEALRQEEMVKAAKKLTALSERDLDVVEKVTKGIVAKLLHGPMNHLRQQTQGDATRAAILQVQQAFQLEH